jgi:hypothetical protein
LLEGQNHQFAHSNLSTRPIQNSGCGDRFRCDLAFAAGTAVGTGGRL